MQAVFYLFRTVTIVPASKSCSILPFFSQNIKRQPKNRTATDRSIQTERSNALEKEILSPVSKSETLISCNVMPKVPCFSLDHPSAKYTITNTGKRYTPSTRIIDVTRLKSTMINSRSIRNANARLEKGACSSA